MKPVRARSLADGIVAALQRGRSGAAPAPAAPESAARGPEPRAPLPARPGMGHGRLLLAEDNAINQKVGVKMVERMGWRVDLATNGLEAVAAVRRTEYDLVLMDCQMPEMDGFDATREIRKLGGRRAGVPIVAMTASAMQGDRERCLDTGMDDYISKPVAREELERVLERYRPEASSDPVTPSG
jgi:CheY-like chemotaxis protein